MCLNEKITGVVTYMLCIIPKYPYSSIDSFVPNPSTLINSATLILKEQRLAIDSLWNTSVNLTFYYYYLYTKLPDTLLRGLLSLEGIVLAAICEG